MTDSIPDLVSTDWLESRLAEPDIVILDASRHLPASGRNARSEFETSHIPGARFLDLESLTDPESNVPAAIPSPDQLSARLDALGITPSSAIILYDDSAVKTSARAWFILIAHGIDNVAILDGGLSKWRSEGRALEQGRSNHVAVTTGGVFSAKRIASKADVLSNLQSELHQIIDARSADRVFGSGIDPVHGGQNGRIPGSLNVPFGTVFNADGTFKTGEELEEIFQCAGTDLTRPVIATCGSGVTASVLLFALHLIGKHDTALYDGSWQEWEADPETPKAQGSQSSGQ